jgi:hypothetical protein
MTRTMERKNVPAGEEQSEHPRQQPYGKSENYGSPGGDEPPATTDPASGSAEDARERHERPETK